MLKMVKIILVRHGESEMNRLGIPQGSLHDPCLSENGINQAKRLAERLKEEGITEIYSGDKKRVLQTAKIIGDYLNLNIKEDNKLNEFNMGDFDKTYERGDELFKEFYEKEFAKGISKYEIRPPNGENYWDLIKRVKSFLKEISNKKETILVVSHEGTIEVFLNVLEERDKEKDGFKKYHQVNSSINEIIFNNGDWKILNVNDFRHLNLIKQKKRLYENQEKIYNKIIEKLREKIQDFIYSAYLFGSALERDFGRYENRFDRHYGSNIDVLAIMEKSEIPLKWRFVSEQAFWTIYEGGKIEIEGVKHRIDFYVVEEPNKKKAMERLEELRLRVEEIK